VAKKAGAKASMKVASPKASCPKQSAQVGGLKRPLEPFLNPCNRDTELGFDGLPMLIYHSSTTHTHTHTCTGCPPHVSV
jgi:hypothetical protein